MELLQDEDPSNYILLLKNLHKKESLKSNSNTLLF